MLFTYYDPVTVDGKQLTNIYKNYKGYIDRILPNYRLKTYYIKGSPRPEQLAYQLYGNQELYWVLLMINNIYDPYYGWITDQETAYQQAIQRYQNVGGQKVVYHQDEDGNKYYNLIEHPIGSGNWYDKGDKVYAHLQYNGSLYPVDTYGEYTDKNELKRTIRIIDSNDITRFINDLTKVMETGI